MDRFYRSCQQILDCNWSRYTFSQEDMEEILARSSRFYNGPDICKRELAWRTYVDLIGHMVLAKEIADPSALKGFCILNNLIFDWEDDLCSLHRMDEIIDVINDIVNDYFPEQFRHQNYTSFVNCAYCYSITRKYGIKEKVCNTADELYHLFRLSDAGIISFLIGLCATYGDRDLLHVTSQEYVSGLGMRPFMHVNDVFSFNKEVAEGEMANEITITLRQTNMPQEELLQQMLHEIETDMNRLKLLLPGHYPIFTFWLRGNLEWSYITYRYHF